MIKAVRFLIISLFLVSLIAKETIVMADPPNPPVVPGNHGQGGNINGAPVDGMSLFLLLSGAIYGGRMLTKKAFGSKKGTTEE